MRTLVLYGDNGHPASLTGDGLVGLADGGYEFEWVEDPGEWSAERMDDYPLIVFSKANERAQGNSERWATEEMGKMFIDYVRRGRSVLFLHSGTAFYDDSPSLCNLMGGIFARHPAPCPVTVEPRTGHPMVAGSDAFTLPDEHYHMTMFDPDVDLFLETVSEHGTQPAGWTRTEGDGRVCVLTPGHYPDVWSHPSYQALLRNALAWCAAGAEEGNA